VSVSSGLDLYSGQVGPKADWQTWSGGHTPQVLATATDVFSVTGTFTVPQKAFGLEMEPDDFYAYNTTLTLGGGSSLSQSVEGNSGAAFFGWVGDAETTMTLSSDIDFAFGRMVQPVPVPPTVLLLGSGLLSLLGWRRFNQSS